MAASNKPGVDWLEIEQRVKAGQSYRAIERSLKEQGIKISHEAISQRARREGWKKLPSSQNWEAGIRETKTALITAKPTTNGEKRIVTIGKRSPENAEKIVALIQAGRTQKTAAAAVGISPGTLINWREDDPEFAERLRLARLESLGEAESSIVKAHERGDWRAAHVRLQADKDTSEDWGQANQGGGGLQININLRGHDSIEAPTIDITPSKASE